MRIISQDKMTDTPYDGAVIYIHRLMNNHIYIGNIGDEVGFSIGVYNSKEDAIHVMELIRESFLLDCSYFFMPDAERSDKRGEQE